jgi:hypothetical protein
LRGGGRGEGNRQLDKQYIEGAVVFWGDVAVHWAVLLGGGQPCNRRCAHGRWHWGGRCSASGGVVGGEAAMQDTVEAVGERRWCNEQRRGCGPHHLETTQWCNGWCCWGRGGGATDDGGGAVVCLYVIFTWAWARSIGGRRWIPLTIK